jgi:hypothetical protein
MDNTKETTRQDALRQAKEMFDKFDIDDKRYSGLVLMYDNEKESFSMLSINSDAEDSAFLLTTGFEAIKHFIEAQKDTPQVLN